MSAALRVLEVEDEKYFLLRIARVNSSKTGGIPDARVEGLLEANTEVIVDADGQPRFQNCDEVIPGFANIGVKPVIVSHKLKACGIAKTERRFQFCLCSAAEVEVADLSGVGACALAITSEGDC